MLLLIFFFFFFNNNYIIFIYFIILGLHCTSFSVIPEVLYFSDVVGDNIGSIVQTITFLNIEFMNDIHILDISIDGTDASQFSIKNQFTFPIDITIGGSQQINVLFTATSLRELAAVLHIITDSGNATIPLKGLGTKGLGGTNEPSLQQILDTFDIKINVGDDDPTTNIINSDETKADSPLLGPDEISLHHWKKSCKDLGPVLIDILAVFTATTVDPSVTCSWYSIWIC